MKIDENNSNYTEQTASCILECIERFAPVTKSKQRKILLIG